MAEDEIGDGSDIADLTAERDRLVDEVMRLRIERATGVPASLLAQAHNEAEARQIAADAVAWKTQGQQTAPQRNTGAAVPSPYTGVGQVSRATLESMTPEQRMAAARAGMLTGLGVGVPNRDQGTQRNGRHV